ncbi:MAG: hypothetical protein MdMp014T_1546 [Treponematales bacterium]
MTLVAGSASRVPGNKRGGGLSPARVSGNLTRAPSSIFYFPFPTPCSPFPARPRLISPENGKWTAPLPGASCGKRAPLPDSAIHFPLPTNHFPPSPYAITTD